MDPGIPSNAIGNFQIGVSPIGTITPFVFSNTIISQYSNSPRLYGLIELFAQYFDPTQLLDSFFDNMWNIDTAVGYGLDVWGRIIGVNRVLQIADGRFFGFVTGSTDFDPYNVSPYFTGTGLTSNYRLTDDAYRLLILAKAAANITDGSIPSLNALLTALFGASGKAYVVNFGGMAMAYKFEFIPSPVQASIILNSGVLPQPTGVALSIITPNGTFTPPHS